MWREIRSFLAGFVQSHFQPFYPREWFGGFGNLLFFFIVFVFTQFAFIEDLSQKVEGKRRRKQFWYFPGSHSNVCWRQCDDLQHCEQEESVNVKYDFELIPREIRRNNKYENNVDKRQVSSLKETVQSVVSWSTKNFYKSFSLKYLHEGILKYLYEKVDISVEHLCVHTINVFPRSMNKDIEIEFH